MISKVLKISLVVLVVVAGIGTFAGFRIANTRLRERMEALRQSQAESGRLREANERAKTLLARMAGDQDTAARAFQSEVGRLRREVAELERRAIANAAQRTAQLSAAAEALANNRDPQLGLTRLEHFQNRGQGTPGAAFQTLVWAALKGDDAMLAQVCVASAPARTGAEALIARLPESARGQWTPEKLAAMFFTGALSEVTAAQVVAESPKDAHQVELSVLLTGRGGSKDPTIPLQWRLGANGWQVVFDEKMLGAVQKKIANAEAPVPPKK